ncbi:hypothetical protein [Tsuneonella deserti]|nr:hypothetical protein [Tsuneonella deserti]
MPHRAYLSSAMLRRILACLALITGLASIATPAEARMMLEFGQQVENSPAVSQGGQQAACNTTAQRTTTQAKAAAKRACTPRRAIVVYIPTVQLGPDRARE